MEIYDLALLIHDLMEDGYTYGDAVQEMTTGLENPPPPAKLRQFVDAVYADSISCHGCYCAPSECLPDDYDCDPE